MSAEAADPDLHREQLAENLQDFLLKLDETEAKVAGLAVPQGYAEELYALRVHIDLLRNKLQNAAQQGERSGESDSRNSTS